MAVFKDHKLKLSELFKVIPEDIFAAIAEDTNVDYYVKSLYGKLLYYLLLYALLTDEKLGQRGICDLYSSPHFRLLFNFQLEKDKIAHSSLSERLSKVEVDYFKQLYEYIYARFSTMFPTRTISGLKLQRVDSSLVTETSNKLAEGLSCGNEYKKSKMLKYTINYDGMYGSFAHVHKEEKYASESLALPENVIDHFKSSADHANVYIFDRGQSSANFRAETIALMYCRRWDIEVFFRFLKQEVNFSHFISLSDNGIQVILYMTLIAAMLIMIYKTENELGFKRAKRRMEIELQELIIAIAVVLSGGDLNMVNLPAP
jgi:hypothetical protein